MSRGVFLSLDGLDGSGKSTQCRLLAVWLRQRGHTVTECREPGGTTVGDVVRELLLGHRHALALPCEALLFMASRAQLVAEIIRPALAAGHVVISDRYLLANVVYQGHAGGLDPDQLWSIGSFATGGLEPDLTLVLDLPEGEALARRGGRAADRMEDREAAYHTRVRQGFLHEAQRRPERVRVIDACGAVEPVQEKIREEVLRVLEARQRA
jgi:dTMP kinase